MTPRKRNEVIAGMISGNSEQLSRALRKLPARVPPLGLATCLRILASKERQRRNLTFAGWYALWLDRLRLASDNMMRPLALPLAGGVFSAIALFSMWLVPTYPLHANNSSDVPTVLTTEAAIKSTSAIGAMGGDTVVDVTIDDQGRMVDYKVVSGTGVLQDAALRHSLENALLFTEFVPATAFGRPMAGKIRLYLGSSRIDVRG
jgi:hypothetical protein